MQAPTRPGTARLLAVSMLVGLVVALAGVPAAAEELANANARPDGWMLNFGQPTLTVPDTYVAHLERGKDLTLKGNHESAAAEYLECIRLFRPYVTSSRKPGTFRDSFSLDVYTLPLATASVNLGHTLKGMGRLDTAIDLYSGAADIAPGYVPAHESLGSAQIDKGWARRLQRFRDQSLGGTVLPDAEEINLYRSAVAHLHVARQLEPNNATVRLALSRGLRLWGVPDGALVQAQKAVELDPTNYLTHQALALALAARGEPSTLKGAADAFKEAARLAADEPQANQAQLHDGLAMVLAAMGDEDGAVEAYRKACALAPTNAQYQNNLGAALQRTGKVAEARQALATAVSLEPGGTTYLANLATTSREDGDLDAAITTYQEAIRHAPDNARFHEQLGWTLYQRSNPDTAISQFMAVSAMEPTDDQVRQALATFALHFFRNERLNRVDAMDPRVYDATPRLVVSPDPQAALRDDLIRAWNVIEDRPLYGQARIELQHMLLDFDSLSPAVMGLTSDYIALLQANNPAATASVPLSLPASVLRQVTPGRDFDDSIKTLSPKVRRTVLGVAAMLQRADDSAEAISELRWAMRLNPDAETANNLGKALFDAGDIHGALGMYDTSIAMAGDIAEVHFNRGVALGRLGDMNGAMAEWERALALNMRDVRLYTFLGIGYLQQAEFDYANAMLFRALEVDADFAPALYYNGLLQALRQSASPITLSALQRARLKTELGRPHYDVRAEFIKQDALGDALAELAKADAADPNRERWYYYTGIELALQDPELSANRGADVIHSVAGGYGLMPDWACVSSNIAVAKALAGQTDEAEQLLRTAVADEPNYALGHWNLGRVLMLNKREGEAKLELYKAAKLAREQGLSYYFQADDGASPRRALDAPLPRIACEAMMDPTLAQSFYLEDRPL